MPDVDLTYKIGTVSVDALGTVVSGAGGMLWSQSPNMRQWDVISIDGSDPVPLVASATDDTHLTIPAWQGGAKVAVSYVIYQLSPLRFAGGQTMADVDKLLAVLNTDGFYEYVNPAYADPTSQGLTGNEGQFALKASTGQLWLMTGGVWVLQGVFGALAVDPVEWSGTTTYAAKVIVPWAGKLFYSLQPVNLNHQPDTSPTWWSLFLSGGDSVWLAMDDSDRPATGETVLQFVAPKAMTFLAAMSDSFGHAFIGATTDAIYSICKNGTQFATAKFAAGGQAGPQFATFTCAANEVLAPGDIVTMIAPTPRDATLSTVGITLVGYR